MFRTASAAILLIAVRVAPFSAQASVILPPAQGEICLSDCSQASFEGPGTYTSRFGTATIADGPDPTVSLDVEAPPGMVGNTTSWASLYYSFEVVGPTNASVPITAFVNLSSAGAASSGSPSYFFDSFAAFNMGQTIENIFGGPNSVIACSDAVKSQCEKFISAGYRVTGSSFSGNIATFIPSNSVEQIELFVQGQAGGGSATSFADPILAIDPGFLAANPGFSLVLSEGIGNPVADIPVPEPASWSLLGTGILALLLCLSNRASARRKLSAQRL